MSHEEFIHTLPGDPRARPLVEQLSHEYESRYGELFRQAGESAGQEMARYPDVLFTPAEGGLFVLLLRDGVSVAGGAFKRHPDARTAEVKRVWTDRLLRRQGLARRLLVELEVQALRQGYRRLFLTTGFRQPEAVELYLRQGYTALFAPDADLEALRSLPFEKVLSPALTSTPSPAFAESSLR